MKSVTPFFFPLLLASCAVGPTYKAPAPAAGAFVSDTGLIVSEAPLDQDWWRLYDDPVLDQLVQDALRANTDIRIAIAHLERARAELTLARSARLPSTSFNVNGGYQRTPDMLAIPGESNRTAIIDIGIAVNYEMDLFGRVKRSIEAAHAEAAAAEADVDAVRVIIVAETTRAYIDAASTAHRIAVAQHSVDLLEQSVRLTSKRFDTGRAAKVDVLRIETLKDQQAAQIPALETERKGAVFRLALLTGRQPNQLAPSVTSRDTPPNIHQPIPMGNGADLLQRRPDVRGAERRLAANTARIGMVTADLYPHITLGGSIGQTSPTISDLFSGGVLRYLVGPLISWDFPNQSATRARIAASKADARASLAQFDGTVLQAIEETETALSSYADAIERHRILEMARDHANVTARIVRARQREGQVDFLVVLDAERTLADTEADVATADARVSSAQIDLFKALGGGWESARPLAFNDAESP